MKNKRKIAVITGSRADYGLLKTLISLINKNRSCELKLFVTGSHLSPKHGMTVNDIERDGFKIDAKIEILLSSDTNLAMAKSTGLAVLSFADLFDFHKPDIVVVLGDRYEILAATQAAYCLKIPIAHIHGGEVTEGALDDNFRHAMTKFSHLHFVSHEDYKRRIIQLGEDPRNVYVCGAPGLDLIPRISIKDRKSFCLDCGLDPKKEYALVNLHPSTLDDVNHKMIVKNLYENLAPYKDLQILVTLANADPEGFGINESWHDYALSNPEKIKSFANLGSALYFNAISHAKLVIGNSSSGILEVPYFNKPTVNIGKRQTGRVMPESVISSGYSTKEIKKAIELAIDSEWQKKHLFKDKKIYGNPGQISQKILGVLSEVNLKNIIYKRFRDI